MKEVKNAEAPLPPIKDILGQEPHTWVEIPQNPMKKPLWPPVTLRVNEYAAVVPRGQKRLLANPLVEQLEHAKRWDRSQLNFSKGSTLSAAEAHAIRVENPTAVFPQTCAAPADYQPTTKSDRDDKSSSSAKKGK